MDMNRMEDRDVAVGARVKVELDKIHMSQGALARELGATRNFVNRRVRGETPFRAAELEAVAEILAVPVEQFLRGAA
jgi:transcriptional regulator with XRE-family HTH domain